MAVRLDFRVTQQHSVTFENEEQFAQWVELHFRTEVDPANLDEVYNRLDREDWKATEALHDLATDGNWVDNVDARIDDLQSVA